MIAFLLFLNVESSSASSFREVKQVNNSSLIVKKAATSSSKTIGSLPRGEFVTVFSKTNGWAYVQGKTLTGYVDAKYLATPKSTIKIASSKGGLVVKRIPTMKTNTLATLKYNMIVEDFGSVGDGWSFVQYGNVTGYVVSSFINTPKTTRKYVNTASGVVVRNIASPSGASKGTLPNGTEVKVHSTLAGWAYVSTGNQRGYVVARFLSDKKPQLTAASIRIGMNENTVSQILKKPLLTLDSQTKVISFNTTKFNQPANVMYVFENKMLKYIGYDFILSEKYHTSYEIKAIFNNLSSYAIKEYGNNYQYLNEKYTNKHQLFYRKNGELLLLVVHDDELYTEAQFIIAEDNLGSYTSKSLETYINY